MMTAQIVIIVKGGWERRFGRSISISFRRHIQLTVKTMSLCARIGPRIALDSLRI